VYKKISHHRKEVKVEIRNIQPLKNQSLKLLNKKSISTNNSCKNHSQAIRINKKFKNLNPMRLTDLTKRCEKWSKVFPKSWQIWLIRIWLYFANLKIKLRSKFKQRLIQFKLKLNFSKKWKRIIRKLSKILKNNCKL